MVDQITTWIGFGFAGIVLVVYILRDSKADLKKAVNLSLSSIGVGVSVRIFYIAIIAPPKEFGETDQMYLFIGAIAVLWVSIEQIKDIMK